MATYTQSKWELTDLFPAIDSPELEQAIKSLKEKVDAFENYRASLVSDISSEKFMEIVHEMDAISDHGSRLFAFAELKFNEDTQSQAAQGLLQRIQQLVSELQNKTLFFDLWWKALDDENAKRLLEVTGDYRYYFEALRNFKKYTLTEPEEKIINTKNVTGFNAMNLLYDSITNRYTFKLKIGRKTHDLTRGELMIYARHHEPALREAAYKELYRVYGNDSSILGQIYQTVARDWSNENVKMRGYPHPISSRNLTNDIPDAVVDTLLDVCKKNASVFQGFFKVKANLLGVDKLRRYDIYAPISKSDKRYPYNKATKMVFESFNEFDPRFAKLAKRVLDQKHLDSEVRKGKRDGAFCLTVAPSLTPWVLCNYQGHADDVATMAHELGHAIHAMLAEHHTIFTQQACLPLAETASTFGEMMLVDKMLKEEPDKAVQRDIIFRQLDDAYATITRQAFFAMFERQAFEMTVNDASVDQLSDAYLENLKTQFGDAVDVSDEFRWEWVCIPHIYNYPFYVYAYSFGQLLVFSLYQQFKQEGESFKPRYIELLSAGSSKAPVNVLSDAGIDVYQPSFWQGGFDVISGMVKQLEQ
ncbi:MAG: M3 family oligoendopeptidase [Anaerolineaceae bacterium]